MGRQGSDVCISTWTRDTLSTLSPEQQKDFRSAVDNFGVLSARAQGLPAAITDYSRLQANPHTLYLACRREPDSSCLKVLGGLKTGRKKLFIIHQARYAQLEPVCVLDFFVHESVQRQGLGFQLFQAFLQQEGVIPERLAYDRPSPKFLHFLAKYFGLKDYIPQNNKYVLFEDYWRLEPENDSEASSKPRRARSACEQQSPNLVPVCMPAASAAVSPPPQNSSPLALKKRAVFASRPSSTPSSWQAPAAAPVAAEQGPSTTGRANLSPGAGEPGDAGQQVSIGRSASRPGTSPAQSNAGNSSSGADLQPQWNPSRPPWALHLPPRHSSSLPAAR